MRPQGSNLLVVVGVDGSGRTHRLVDGTEGRATLALHPDLVGAEVADLLGSARETGALVLADDADLLAGDVLALLVDAVRSGQSLRMSRRPVAATPALGRLDALVAATGDVVELGPLDAAGVGAMLARIRGAPVDPAEAESVRQASAGLPVYVAAAGHDDASASGRVRARISHQLARIGPRHQRLLELLALADDVHDDVLARALDTDRQGLSAALSALRLAGLVVPGTDHLVPVVAEAVRAALSPASQREIHDALARALLASSGPGAAAQLRAASAQTPQAIEAYVAEGERIRYDAPDRAAEWFDLALASGAPAAAVAAGVAETAVLLGQPVVPDPTAAADPRVAIALGVGAAHQGRPARAAELLLAAPGAGPALAVVPLMAGGDLARAEGIATTTTTTTATAATAPAVVGLLADAACALVEPARAVPLLIEAAEALEAAPDVLLPDTPHAVGSVAALVAGDVATAEHLLVRACDEGVGGPAGLQRHRLLLAWLWATTGRTDRARAELLAVAGERAQFPGRERLLVAAVRAALARRSSEASQLREAWTEARPVLARRTVDLLAAPVVEDLVVAAARMREPDLVAATLDDLEAAVARLGDPVAWRVLVGWTRLQAAVATEDTAAADAAATALVGLVPSSARQRALVAAAPVWAAALAGQVDLAVVAERAGALADAGADWDASRLCGNAALRTTDAAASRQLLERARDFADSPARGEDGAGGALGGLSEREVEVARLVVAGETYKVIGARLFLSPKTVEHHVARIRTKLGAASRAELIALLREGGL